MIPFHAGQCCACSSGFPDSYTKSTSSAWALVSLSTTPSFPLLAGVCCYLFIASFRSIKALLSTPPYYFRIRVLPTHTAHHESRFRRASVRNILHMPGNSFSFLTIRTFRSFQTHTNRNSVIPSGSNLFCS